MAQETSTTPSVKDLQKQVKELEKALAAQGKAADKALAASSKALAAAKKERDNAVVTSSLHASKETRGAIVESFEGVDVTATGVKVLAACTKLVKSFRYPGEGRGSKEA